jgi:hypothetical protein
MLQECGWKQGIKGLTFRDDEQSQVVKLTQGCPVVAGQ